jgi:hypothetical protein
MRSELLAAYEKPGQFPLLTVYVVPVLGEKYFFSTLETSSFSCECPVYINICYVPQVGKYLENI